MANKSIDIDFDFRAVCSDETVADTDRNDAALSHTSDLGVPVITDLHEIATFLRQRSGERVVFAIYHSSPKIAGAFRLGRVPAFDLVIVNFPLAVTLRDTYADMRKCGCVTIPTKGD